MILLTHEIEGLRHGLEVEEMIRQPRHIFAWN